MTTEILKLGLWWALTLALFYATITLIAEHMPLVP